MDNSKERVFFTLPLIVASRSGGFRDISKLITDKMQLLESCRRLGKVG